MRICLATYEGRLAALLENATGLSVYEAREDHIVSAGGISMPQGGPEELLKALRALGVKVLICGAVSHREAELLRAGGIRLADWIGGDTQAVLVAWQQGRLEQLALPGRIKKAGRAKSPFTALATGSPANARRTAKATGASAKAKHRSQSTTERTAHLPKTKRSRVEPRE